MLDQAEHSALKTEEVSSEAQPDFRVSDAASANWVVRKIVEARAYAARVKAWAELELRRAERDERDEHFLLRRFGVELEDWTRRQITQQHDKRQSVSLPAGRVGFRVEPTKLCVVDEKQLLAWCRQNLPSAIRTSESVQKSSLKDHFMATGECPTGTDVSGGNQKFYVSEKKLNLIEGAQHATA